MIVYLGKIHIKQILFILTHSNSGSTLLARILNYTNKVAVIPFSNLQYNHLSDLYELEFKIKNNRTNDFAPIYGDVLKYNTDLYCRQYFKFCKFIFLLREPANISYDYYRFRLRRLYEYSKFTKNAICMTYRDIINKNFGELEKFLNIKEPITGFYETYDGDTGDIAAGKIIETKEIEIPDVVRNKYETYLRAIRKNLTQV